MKTTAKHFWFNEIVKEKNHELFDRAYNDTIDQLLLFISSCDEQIWAPDTILVCLLIYMSSEIDPQNVCIKSATRYF